MAKRTKFQKIAQKIAKEEGIDSDNAFIHVGECMDADDLLFTDSAIDSAMHAVFAEAIAAVKAYPEAQAALRKHFDL